MDKSSLHPIVFFTNVCHNLEEKICHYFDLITTLNSCYAASEAVKKSCDLSLIFQNIYTFCKGHVNLWERDSVKCTMHISVQTKTSSCMHVQALTNVHIETAPTVSYSNATDS